MKNVKCPYCKKNDAYDNRARTVFCPNCKISVSRCGLVERRPEHPLFDKHGYNIQSEHSDFKKYYNTKNKVEYGNYGPVKAIRGRHIGKIGYYDDDEGNRAVVYFGEPHLSKSYLINHEYLVPAENFLPVEKFVRENPDLSEQAGIKSKRKSHLEK